MPEGRRRGIKGAGKEIVSWEAGGEPALRKRRRNLHGKPLLQGLFRLSQHAFCRHFSHSATESPEFRSLLVHVGTLASSATTGPRFGRRSARSATNSPTYQSMVRLLRFAV